MYYHSVQMWHDAEAAHEMWETIVKQVKNLDHGRWRYSAEDRSEIEIKFTIQL